MADLVHQPRDENGQFVSIGTLFEQFRNEHQEDHNRELIVAKETAQRMEREVEETAKRMETTVRAALSAHEAVHTVEKEHRKDTEVKMDKRLEGMNEFRDALSDQASRAVSRELFDATIAPLQEFRSRAMGAAVVLTLVAGAVGAALVRVFS
jgi:hypothetical protein